jgi:hypothetical protein
LSERNVNRWYTLSQLEGSLCFVGRTSSNLVLLNARHCTACPYPLTARDALPSAECTYRRTVCVSRLARVTTPCDLNVMTADALSGD